MEALVLAAALRVVGTAVDQIDAELEQPHAEPGPALARGVAPGRAVVDEDRLWQAVAAEGRDQVSLHRAALLIGAGRKARREARVVVDHGQRMAALAAGQGDPALEVHLPQLVGRLSLEALARSIG